MKKGWEVRQWKDVVDIRSGRNQTEVENPKGKYPIMGSAGKTMGYANEYISEEGSILIGRKGTIDNPLYIEHKYWNVDTAFGLHAINRLDGKFLFYFCQNYDFTKEDKGSGRPSLVKSDLLQIQIPIPPLPEQKRIVAILDEAFCAIAKAKANAEQNLKNAKELFESYLQSVFENKGDDWEEKTLEQVCQISSKLIDPKKQEYQSYIHIGAGNIESQKGTLVDLKTAKEEGLISGKFLFDESMVLYSKIRPYLMKVVNCSFNGLCSADIYPLHPFEGVMTKNFLYHLLLTKEFTEYAILGSQRAGMPKVNREHLFAYKFYLPPIKEQIKCTKVLEALSVDIMRLESIYQQKISDLEELKKTILQKAFNGELNLDRVAV